MINMRFVPYWIQRKWQGFSEIISEEIALPKCYAMMQSGKPLTIAYFGNIDIAKARIALKNICAIETHWENLQGVEDLASKTYDLAIAGKDIVFQIRQQYPYIECIALQRIINYKVAYIDTELFSGCVEKEKILLDAFAELFLRLKENEENRMKWTKFQNVPDFEEVRFQGLPNHIKAGYLLTAVNGNKRKTFCFYGVPKEGALGGNPAVVLVHGAGGNAFYRWVDEWTKRGYAAISIDINCTKFENEDLEHRVKNEDAGELNIAGFNHLLKNPKDSWIYYSVSQIISANSFMRAQPFVDETRIGLVGISWGGVVSLIALSADQRFRLGSIIYSAGFITEDKLGEETGIFEDYEKKRFYDSFFDARNYVKDISVPILFHSGLQDGAFTPFSRQRCCDLMTNEKHFALTKELYHDNESNFVNENVISFFDDCCFGKQKRAKVEFILQDDLIAFTSDKEVERVVLCYVDETYIPHKTPWQELEGEADGKSGKVKIPTAATAYICTVYYGEGLYTSSKLYRRKNQ